MSYYGWAPYVTVAQRRAKARKQLEKMKKKGLDVQPVHLSGRKIAGIFLGQGLVRSHGVVQRLCQPFASGP